MIRPIRRLLICMLLGAIATVVVSWVLAITTVVNAPLRTPVFGVEMVEGGFRDERTGRVWWCQVIERPGLTVVVWDPIPGMTMDPDGTMSGHPGYAWTMRYGLPKSHWLRLDPKLIPDWAGPPLGGPVIGYLADSARGWPARALYYSANFQAANRSERGGIRVPRALRPLGRGLVLPLRVHPAGFLINTVVYGLVILALSLLYGAWRRAHRSRHERCVACGYDLSGAVGDRCSECGQPAPRAGCPPITEGRQRV